MEVLKTILELVGENFIIPMFQFVIGPAVAILAAKAGLAIIHAMEKKKLIELDDAQEAQVRAAIAGAVTHTNQTFVDDLKNRKRSGKKLNKKQIIEAMHLTMKKAKSDLLKLGTEKAKALASDATGKLLKDKVEEALASGFKSDPKGSGR